MKPYILLIGVCLIGTLFHSTFLSLNEILKVADSYAYIQMSHFLLDGSIDGLGTGWFGFLYSAVLSIFLPVFQNELLGSQIINLGLLNISGVLIYLIATKIPLGKYFPYIAVGLFFLSPVYLHFGVHVLSENLYIPLFLGVFLLTWNLCEMLGAQTTTKITRKYVEYIIALACLLGCMYLTRAEAFIYMLSIGLIASGLLVHKKLSLTQFMTGGVIFFGIFFLFVSPYLFHLHGLTGTWGLTNKGASNLRQAELRGVDKMDDAGFEQAVAELTDDKHHLIAGFAGGMPYDTPQISESLGEFVAKDPIAFLDRVSKNQIKLFSRNLPEIFLGKSPSLYWSDDTRFSNIMFFTWCLIPLLGLVYGVYITRMKYPQFFWISLAFFVPALMFFTLFFTLNRYFLIFLPVMIIFWTIGLGYIWQTKKILGYILLTNYISILLLSTSVYYHSESPKDDYYALKQEAGLWLSEHHASRVVTAMERFPIVTYYAGAPYRYITPYTDDIADIREYARYNDLDILVVDTMDFATYRPELIRYLDETPEGFRELQKFENSQKQKVILYELEKYYTQ